MLNYTSKIQHFLNLHRKHTKYIVVLLLLSAFVASFVCSALTEPAVSMTEPIQMGQNVTLLADGDQSDGLPIISGHYENSQFKDYIKWDTQTSTDGRLLGSAHNFALFAFEEINIKTPCYGNLLSKKLNVNANFGLENIASAGGQSITIATESFLHGGGAQSKNTVLLVPQNVNFYNEQGNPVTINPIPKVQIKQPDGTTGHFEKGTIDVYAYHVTSGFIDFTAEKNNFITLQNWLVAQGINNDNSIINLNESNIITRDQTNNDQFRQIKIDNKGVNYLNIDYKNLPTDSKSLDLYLAKDAAVIINVDCKDVTENIKTSFQFREHQNGNEIGNDSEAYLKGTNVLWNFYNSSDTTNLQFDKEIHIGNSSSGIILAPSSNVYLNSQHTGGVIANKIETSATFTKAMFMTSMESFASGSIAVMAKKNWQNNEIPEGASVQVELYRSKTPNVDITNLPDGEKVGDTLTLNAGNYWNATWFDLDQSYYYYVKELPVSANGKFYKAAYTNNGRNTTGTVDIENSIIEIESGGDNEGGETETPTQTIDITVEIKSNPTNLFYNSNEETNGKNISLYRTTTPNLTVDKLPTGDNIVPETGEIKEADRDKFPSDMELVISDLPEYDINNNEKQKSYFIRQKDNWQHTFKDQPMFDENGKPYYYYAKETWHQTDSTIGYENVYLGNGAYLKDSTITMYAIKTIDINVVKDWQNTNGSNPNSVKFEIWRSYTQQQSIPSDAQWVSTNELNSNNNWSAKVKNVPISDINNNTYYYYIKETEIENNSSKLNEYDISYSTNAIYSDRANDSYSIAESNITITNKKKAEDKISITVKKDMRGKDNDYWNDQTFKFTLYRGTDSNNIWGWVQEYQLTKSNNWEITINDLEKNNNGQPYYYRVDETNTPSTFDATYSTESLNAGTVSGNGTIWIYNNPKKVSLNIQKIWDPIDIVNKIKYVKIKVYQVKSTDYQMAQTLLLNNSLTFNSYINMLNDSSTPTINGNTATYTTGLNFVESTTKYSNHKYNVWIKFDSRFAQKRIQQVDVILTNATTITTHYALHRTQEQVNNGDPNAYQAVSQCNFNINNSTQASVSGLNTQPITENDYLIITGGDGNNHPGCNISSIIITFDSAIQSQITFPTGTWNNNVLEFNTQQGYNDTNKIYSEKTNNIVYKLPTEAAGKYIDKIDITWSSIRIEEQKNYYIICSNLDLIKLINSDAVKSDNTQGFSSNGNKLIYIPRDDNYYHSSLGPVPSETDCYLVFAADDGTTDLRIDNLKITFADSGGDEIYSDVAYQTFNKSDYNPNKDGSDKIEHNNLNTIDIPSKYSGKRVTKVESYFYNRQGCQGYTNDAATWQTVYNIMAKKESINEGDLTEEPSWNNNVFTKTFTYYNETQGRISGFDFKTPYPDHLEKVVVYFNDGSTYTVMNNKFGKIDYSASMEFKGATYDESTQSMNGDTNHYIVADYSPTNDSNKPYVGKTVKNIQFYFHGLAENDKNNGELYKHTLNVYGREYKDGSNWATVNANSSSWSGDILTTTYQSVVVTGFSILTRYPNNVEKVVVNYTDDSTFTLYNSKYTGQYEQIQIPTNQPESPIHRDLFVDFLTDTNGTTVENHNDLLSKEVDYVEMYFKEQLTGFPYWETFDVWLGDGTNGVGQKEQSSYNYTNNYNSENFYVAKWEYSNATNAKYIGARTTDNTEVKLVKITYTDGSTFTVVNNKYNQNTPTGKEEIVCSYDFVDGTELKIEKENNVAELLEIPSSFFDSKTVVSIEAYFENLDTFGTLSSKSILDIWISGGKGDWEWCDLEGLQSVTEKDNIRIEDYTANPSENRAKIRQIGIATKLHHQNLNYVVVRFEDESTITIYNNKYYGKVGGTPAEGTTSSTTTTTTLPSDGLITEITLTETNGEWKTTLNDLPMVAPDGTPYYYFIVEVEIGYTDGTVLSGIDNITKKFDVTKNKEYLELSDKDGAENLLSITNSLKLTNVNMPSTGGIGTHPYRNAGILMMICSGGIYISLRALRKKQN